MLDCSRGNFVPIWMYVCRTYRGLYILNWIYRYMTEAGYRQWLGE